MVQSLAYHRTSLAKSTIIHIRHQPSPSDLFQTVIYHFDVKLVRLDQLAQLCQRFLLLPQDLYVSAKSHAAHDQM